MWVCLGIPLGFIIILSFVIIVVVFVRSSEGKGKKRGETIIM